MIATAIQTRLGEIALLGKKQPVFIIEFSSSADSKLQTICYMNCRKTPAGNYAVEHDSKFAKLYRLVTGENPKKRFSKAHQLLPHFVGHEFEISAQIVKPSNRPWYYKVAEITPINPIVKATEWTATGALIGTKRPKKRIINSPKTACELPKLGAKNRRQIGDELATNRRKVGDKKTLEAAETLGLQPFSTSLQALQGKAVTLNTPTTPQPFIRRQGAEETDAEFLDRFLDESLSNTKSRIVCCKSCFHWGGGGWCIVGVPPVVSHNPDVLHDCDKHQVASIVQLKAG